MVKFRDAVMMFGVGLLTLAAHDFVPSISRWTITAGVCLAYTLGAWRNGVPE